MAKTYVLERKQLIENSLEDVFAFFADAANLESLTPPQLRFKILTPLPIVMKAGAIIDYRLKLMGVPFKWRTEIEVFEPMSHFVDRQLRGPYKLWHHTHTFRETDEGVEMNDRVEYQMPFSLVGSVTHAIWVKRQLNSIFDYRRSRTDELLESASKSSR